MNSILNVINTREPWNKGTLIGQKAPLKHRKRNQRTSQSFHRRNPIKLQRQIALLTHDDTLQLGLSCSRVAFPLDHFDA